MMLLINIIVMPFSFLMICFMNDNTAIVNYNLCVFIVCLFSSCLNNMPHVFSYLQVLVFVVLCAIYERCKPWKVVFNFINCSEPFCDVVYLLRDRGMHCLTNLSIFFVYLCKCCSDLGQTKKASQSVSDIKRR